MSEQTVPEGALVVGLDGSAKDVRAMGWAVAEAVGRDIGLHLLFAFPWARNLREFMTVPPSDVVETGHRIVEAAAAPVRRQYPDLTITSEVLLEDPAAALVHASRQAALVVLGARGLGRIAGRLLGSVSQKVTDHAHAPVIVVREVAPDPAAPVVVGIDPDHDADTVLTFAFDHAQRHGLGVRVVHAVEPARLRGDYLDPQALLMLQQADAERVAAVDRLAADYARRYEGVAVEIRKPDLHPIEALTQESGEASLLVVGTGGGGFAGLRLGSVSRGVLHEAPVVAVVPSVPERGRPASAGTPS